MNVLANTILRLCKETDRAQNKEKVWRDSGRAIRESTRKKKKKKAAKQKRQVRVYWDEGCIGFVWEVASKWEFC